MIEGYNIALQINGKTVVGRTQDDLAIAARLVESLTKDNQGETDVVVAGHDVTFSAQGLVAVGNSDASKLDRDDIIEQSLKKGPAAIIPLTYLLAGGDTYSGNAIMTQYTEGSNASDIATWQINFRITGSFSKTPAGSGSGV
ncbi:MAG: hypothetical protein J5639_09295 [Bacteroidales bacterium]|nr:hypothetical protein [Bacteroidales bacterium]